MALNHLALEERFRLQHSVDETTGCWMWTGTIGTRGYGCIKDNYKTKLAHRVSYELHCGAIPAGLHVCHHCDTPACVNPAHLFTGTAQQNNSDKVKKGRQYRPQGELGANSRLTACEVMEIFTSDKPGTQLAAMYGVSRAAISNIKTGSRWGSVTGAQQATMRAERKGYGA